MLKLDWSFVKIMGPDENLNDIAAFNNWEREYGITATGKEYGGKDERVKKERNTGSGKAS